MTQKTNEIVNIIKNVLPRKEFIGLHEPYFSGNELNYVGECIRTGWVSSVGKYVDDFERKLAEYTGVERAIAVVNGTAALFVCLKLLDVKPGDEILIPALSFVATANAVAYCDAIPHFVDSDLQTLGVDPIKLRAYLENISKIENNQCFNKLTGRRIKAIIPMHTFGHPVNLNELSNICEEFKLEMIEDAAESLGSFYMNKHTGNWGELSAVSFNGNKIITTGGGGAILTNDHSLADKAKHITTTAKVPHKWEFNHNQIGFNFRLPNLNAALGCAQMEQIDIFLDAKRNLANQYQDAFKDFKGVSIFSEPKDCRSNYWLNVLILNDDLTIYRDELLQLLNEEGIMTRPVWKLLNKLPMYSHCPTMDLDTAENLEKTIINIPSSAFLGEVQK